MKQQVLELKAELKRAMEAAEASKLESYELGVQETKVCLAEELTEVCRDYCKKVSMDAFNLAGVPATSE